LGVVETAATTDDVVGFAVTFKSMVPPSYDGGVTVVMTVTPFLLVMIAVTVVVPPMPVCSDVVVDLVTGVNLAVSNTFPDEVVLLLEVVELTRVWLDGTLEH
jgi:hypothetical protein